MKKKPITRWMSRSRNRFGCDEVEIWANKPFLREDGTWKTRCTVCGCFTDMDADEFLEIFGWVPKPGECFKVEFT